MVASDAFFPFADGLLVAIEAGATAVIQPGGSVRDDEVIKAADDHGIAMVFTGTGIFGIDRADARPHDYADCNIREHAASDPRLTP